MTVSDAQKIAKTRTAFLLTHILRAPFWAIYHLLIFIMYKDLNASAFQIALLIALKPIVSIFSIYWGAHIHHRPDRLIANIAWGGVLSYLPFLLFPLFYNTWFVLFSAALFMMMYRGVIPAWMEIFKKNLPGAHKQKVFSLGALLSFLVGLPFPVLIAPLIDNHPFAWRWIFFCSALLGMGALIFQLKIPIDVASIKPQEPPSLQKHLFGPWKKAFTTFASNVDFRAYQIGFMLIGGCGLMILQPALPKFFVDVLGLSYTNLSYALTMCKSVAFALTSPLWARLMPKYNIFRFSSCISLTAALFPLILLAACLNSVFIYVAYLAYGAMQAGGELTWHLCGPHFANDEDSSTYSNLNVLTVGLRGALIPQLGAILCLLFPVSSVLVLGSVICFAGALYLLYYITKTKALPNRSVDIA